MIKEHLANYWQQHISAGGGTIFGLLIGQDLLRSVIAGILIFLSTTILKAIMAFISRKLNK